MERLEGPFLAGHLLFGATTTHMFLKTEKNTRKVPFTGY